MSYSIRLIWKAFAPLEKDLPSYQVGLGSLFNVRTGKSLLREIGGGIAPSFYPLVLEPTNVFYNAIKFEQRKGNLLGKKFPLRGQLDARFGVHMIQLECNFGIHVYGNQVCLTISCIPIKVPHNIDLDALQDISYHPSLETLAKRVISIVTTGNRHAPHLGNKLKTYPCIQIIADQHAPDFSQQQLAGLLTRHKNPNANVVNDVFNKNNIHQVDSGLLLLDRQGIVSFVSSTTSFGEKEGNERRFRSCVAMLELSVAVKRLLLDKPTLEGPMLDQINPLIGSPRQTIPNSTSAQFAWQILLKEFDLAESLKTRNGQSMLQNATVKRKELFAWLGVAGSLASIIGIYFIFVPPTASTSNIPKDSSPHMKNCPPMPSSVSMIDHDVKSDINASIGSLGKLKAGEVSIRTEVVAKNLFEKFPNVDRMLTIQIMSATYCQLLADSKSIPESERLSRWEIFQDKLLNIKPTSHNQLPKPRPNPTSDAPAAAALNRIQEVQKFENAKPRLARPFDQTMFHDYPRDIALSWDEVLNADHYEVEIQWQHVLTKDWHMMPRYPVSTKDRTHSFQFIGAGGGRWRIIAINSDGIRSSYSEWRQFLCEK